MNKDEELKLNNLTIQKKKLEKRIKKLNRKDAVLNFLLHEVSGFSHGSDSTPVSMIIGSILSIICMLSTFIVPNVLSVMMLVLSLGPITASIASYGALLRLSSKTKGQLTQLREERKELVNHLDCLKTGKYYVALETKQSAEEKCDTVLIELDEPSTKVKEERRQSLLEKARLRHVEADKSIQGPAAFDNKKEYKEAKEDSKNFLEENGEDLTKFL